MKYHEKIVRHLLDNAKRRNIHPPLSQLQELQRKFFPAPKLNHEKLITSPNWEIGFLLLSLTKKDHSSAAEEKEKVVSRYLLEYCTFPPTCWEQGICLLHRWMALENCDANKDPAIFKKLNSHALLQSLFLLTKDKKQTFSWSFSLKLYNYMVIRGASEFYLMTARHYLLILLLNRRRWIEALSVFRQCIAYKQFPSSSTTGFLVWSLGNAAQWSEVLKVFDHSLTFVLQKSKLPHFEMESFRKSWGTVFSMMMESVSRYREDLLSSMMKQLILANQKTEQKSIARLDGNFIQSLERLGKLEGATLLTVAKKNDFLDHYKIIRGLVSKQRWLDAIRVFSLSFEESSKGGRSSGFLSRSEIGKSRLSLLHASSSTNVSDVVDCINSVRTYGGSYALNDSEIECVLSKSLNNFSPTFWEYCLKLLHYNYTFDPLSKKRIFPSYTAISFLFRNKNLPAHEAIDLFYRCVYDSRKGKLIENSNQKASFSLVLENLLQLLYFQNENEKADEIVLRVSRTTKISLPSAFLLYSSDANLRAVMSENISVDAKVLFHILNHSRDQHPEATRALLCIHLYLEKTIGCGFLFKDCILVADFLLFKVLPSSVHIQVLRCIGKTSYSLNDKYRVLKAYLKMLLCPNLSVSPPDTVKPDLYCIVYEAVIVFINLEETSRNAEQENIVDNEVAIFISDLLDLSMERYECIPPYHMFLPNQIDRLLPIFSRRACQNVKLLHLRVAFARKLTFSTYQLLYKMQKFDTTMNVSLNGLLKLCCRVVEYGHFLKREDGMVLPSGVNGQLNLAQCALQIIELKIRKFGYRSISNSELCLLFKTVGLFSSDLSYSLKTLKIASSIIDDTMRSSSSWSEQSKEKSSSINNKAILYKEFCNNFGWEVGLDVWYKYFPREVLSRVSGNTTAVDYCLSLL